ncbi:MAG TPA: hypothetical protein VGP07_14830 [Polyangia bacterium]|jgi:hypothetical protein
MKYTVEVAHLVSGEVVSVRRLSLQRERMGAWRGVALVAASYFLAMAAVFVGARVLGRGVYAPEFFALWLLIGAGVAALAFSRVSSRLRRYRLGSSLDADAFAPVEVDLVRRSGDRFDLTVVPGMQGYVDTGRSPIALEALTSGRPHTVTFDGDARAEIQIGAATFTVRSRHEASDASPEIPRGFWRLFSRAAVMGAELALVASLFAVIPRAVTIDEHAARLQGPRLTTPWEAEKWLRIEAQSQAGSLYQCFDPLPLSCQHPGYVGVGVSLNREGEMRSNWIARSTFGKDCPVDQCMKDVVSTWEFDPLPEPMRVVLPVQVLRTEKPLPKLTKVAQVVERAGPNAGTPWEQPDGR